MHELSRWSCCHASSSRSQAKGAGAHRSDGCGQVQTFHSTRQTTGRGNHQRRLHSGKVYSVFNSCKQTSVPSEEDFHEEFDASEQQVYRKLDIGSDKISMEERDGVPHHLIDILDFSEDFSAGDFYERAREATEDILKRGRVPIVVGGTGFYLNFFIRGKPQTPVATPESEEKAWEHLRAVSC